MNIKVCLPPTSKYRGILLFTGQSERYMPPTIIMAIGITIVTAINIVHPTATNNSKIYLMILCL